MNLDLALNSVRRLTPLVLPELTRLIAAKKRVLDRWPDIVPDPPERDHEAIILQMLALLDSNRWEDVKMSFVLRALKVAFGPNFRNREDVAPIIDFAFAELEATTQPTFLNAVVAIYLSTYEPKADHSLDLGAKITAKRALLNGKWRAIEDTYPTLFDASCQRRCKTRPRGGVKPGQVAVACAMARAYHRAGACHGALAPWGQIEAI